MDLPGEQKADGSAKAEQVEDVEKALQRVAANRRVHWAQHAKVKCGQQDLDEQLQNGVGYNEKFLDCDVPFKPSSLTSSLKSFRFATLRVR